jgi:hypothetical protein
MATGKLLRQLLKFGLEGNMAPSALTRLSTPLPGSAELRG